MYRGFKRSRIAIGITLAFTIILTVLVWQRNQGRPVYIPILASVLLLGIGCTAARLLGNILSSAACTNLLGILHMDLDPETFLEKFLPVAEKIPSESRDGMICRFYLSDGYRTAGNCAEAKAVLGTLPGRFYDDAPIAGIYYTDLASAALDAGEDPEDTLAELRSVISACGGKHASLRKNLQGNLSLLKARRDAEAGKSVDRDSLNTQLEHAGYKLRRLEIFRILAINARNAGDSRQCRQYLTKLQQEGGKTVYRRWATEYGKTL